ncbi:MAG: AAA family ATPase, partial [Planctomycetaceae bacterium]|nr:AAA family ATPase [Planctomycetaceae bacterium]
MSINDFIGHPLVAWNDYNRNPAFLDKNTRCYIAPKISEKTGVFRPITVDRIEVELNQNVEPFYRSAGAIVEILMQDAPRENTNPNSINPYFMWLAKPGSKQGITIERYRGDDVLQIVHVPAGMDVLLKTHLLTIPSIGLLTKRILIENGGSHYGPFEYSKIDDRSVRLNARLDEQFYIARYSEEAVEPLLIQMTENYGGLEVIDARCLEPPAEENKIDFLSDTELRDYFLNSLDIKSREQLEKIRTLFNTVENQILSSDREQRISRLLRNAEHQDATLRQIAYFVLETPDFREKIMEKIVAERMDMVMKYVPEGSIAPSNISAETDKETAAEQVSIPQTIFEYDPELESRIAEQKAQLMRLTRKYEKTLERLEVADDLDELRKKIKKVKTELETNNKVLNAAKDKLDTVRSEIQQEAKLISKTVDRSFLDLVLKTVGDSEVEETALPAFDISRLSQESRASRIIGRVFDILQKSNRTLPGDETASRNEVANYLICLTQGFITTFAGDPGTGKTSLCHLLARALGLARDDENKRFVEVSVERGWTSHKDFIGYYNPLSKNMEISNREVFNALTLLDSENRVKPEFAAPFVMLLDEANLSPIEHYWAAFLRICDFDSASERTLNMGGHTMLTIPNHLRFLATVNFDHTTEELSPRFIDRSWIITLSPEVISTSSAPASDIVPSKIISFESLLKAFSPKGQKFDPTIVEEWNAVQAIFSENKLPIFPRNLKMVR